jgi:hypothetical protein
MHFGNYFAIIRGFLSEFFTLKIPPDDGKIIAEMRTGASL